MLRRSLTVLVLPAAPLAAQQLPSSAFDDYVARTMKEWKDPGLSIGIVRNDSVIFMNHAREWGRDVSKDDSAAGKLRADEEITWQ